MNQSDWIWIRRIYLKINQSDWIWRITFFFSTEKDFLTQHFTVEEAAVRALIENIPLCPSRIHHKDLQCPFCSLFQVFLYSQLWISLLAFCTFDFHFPLVQQSFSQFSLNIISQRNEPGTAPAQGWEGLQCHCCYQTPPEILKSLHSQMKNLQVSAPRDGISSLVCSIPCAPLGFHKKNL